MIGLLAAVAAGAAPLRRASAATTERVVVDRFTGLAVGGMDPVAYFTEGRAVPGRADLEASAAGAVWRFCNDDNRAFFLAHPEIYGPQFGGYDPVAIGRGASVAGHPEIWTISGERLYLFYDDAARGEFLADPARIIERANQKWPGVAHGIAR